MSAFSSKFSPMSANSIRWKGRPSRDRIIPIARDRNNSRIQEENDEEFGNYSMFNDDALGNYFHHKNDALVSAKDKQAKKSKKAKQSMSHNKRMHVAQSKANSNDWMGMQAKDSCAKDCTDPKVASEAEVQQQQAMPCSSQWSQSIVPTVPSSAAVPTVPSSASVGVSSMPMVPMAMPSLGATGAVSTAAAVSTVPPMSDFGFSASAEAEVYGVNSDGISGASIGVI